MNVRMIFFMLGRGLFVEAFLMCAPLFVSIYFREPTDTIYAWVLPILLILAIAFLLSRRGPNQHRFFAREGFVICALLWLNLSFFGALPLYFSRSYPTLMDAFFEIASGFTTTGASVAQNVEALPHSVLFWRSFSHLIGGMGVLVFTLALVPKTAADSVHMMRAEVPGPVFGKIVSKLTITARILYAIYFSMTGIVILLLLLGGMPLFDSFCHAFGAAGTGGFGIKNNSIAFYDSTYLHNVLSFSMIAFGINFNLYYLLLLKRVRDFWKDEELHWYIGIILTAVVLLSWNVAPQYNNLGTLVRDVFFTVSSVMTTTGYATVDFAQWPLFSHIILLLLMFIGGCAGSTGGGIKVSRIAIYVKSSFRELKRQREPNRALPLRFNQQSVSTELLHGLHSYLMAYILIFIFLLFVTSFDAPDFESAFSAVAATFNNIGPGLGVYGPAGNFASLSPLTKFFLSLGMIAGRLEIWPMLILFSPMTWQKN